MLSGRKITDILTGETLEGSVAKGCLQRDILLPLLCCLIVDKLIQGCDVNGCYTLGNALSSSLENCWKMSQRFFRRLWVWNISGVIELSYQSIHNRFSIWINILWNRVTYTKSLLAGHCTLLKVWGCKAHKRKGCTKKISVVQLHGQLLCLPSLYSILFCSILCAYWRHKKSLGKQSSLADIL